MPDLVTHLASALIPGVALRLDRAALLAFGSVLPDLAGRAPLMGLDLLTSAGVGIPWWVGAAIGALHQPVASGLLAAALSYTLPERDRPAGAAAILAGALLHIGLDALQDYGGYGHPLLFPLTTARFELGLFGPEDSVPLAPAFLLFAALLWAVRAARTRR